MSRPLLSRPQVTTYMPGVQRPTVPFTLRTNHVDTEPNEIQRDQIQLPFIDYFQQKFQSEPTFLYSGTRAPWILYIIAEHIPGLTDYAYPIAGQRVVFMTEEQKNDPNNWMEDPISAARGPVLRADEPSAKDALMANSTTLDALLHKFYEDVCEKSQAEIREVAWTGSYFEAGNQHHGEVQ